MSTGLFGFPGAKEDVEHPVQGYYDKFPRNKPCNVAVSGETPVFISCSLDLVQR